MDKLDVKEKLWGGVFGIVAILAAILELAFGEINVSAVMGMIKDVAGTLVVVFLFIAVLRSMMPKKYSVSFEDRMKAALEVWSASNGNLIVKKQNSDGNDHYGFSMKTDMKSFFLPTDDSANAGWFVRVPPIDPRNYSQQQIEILFNLNRGTFFENRIDLSAEDKNQGLMRLAQYLQAHLIRQHSDLIQNITFSGKDNVTFKVKMKGPIFTDAEINGMIQLIQSMYQGYLVAANIDVTR